MSEFRPSITATTEPSGPPRPRWPTLAAAVVVVALLAGLLWPEPRATGAHVERAATIREEQGSAWDAAIISFRRDDRPRPARADDMPGQAPLAAIRLAPHVVDGEVAGYALAPGELPPALASAGLRSGDVLTTVDGLPLDADRARRLADEFGGLDDVEVTYLRGGEPRDTLIVFRER